MSRCIRHERCPECAKLGKDKHGDNLAIYDNNSEYCFSCGYNTHANSVSIPQDRGSTKFIYLPFDVDFIIPEFCSEWLQKYQLNKLDIIQHNLLWSESLQRLIFPIFINGELIAWQGRYFPCGDGIENSYSKEDKPKWYSIGIHKNLFYILGENLQNKNRIVLVEDIVSAIKISKVGHKAMPLFGSFIGTERLLGLLKAFKAPTNDYLGTGNGEIAWNSKKRTTTFQESFRGMSAPMLVIWLDPDKNKEALKTGKLCDSLGIASRVILSDRDPKEHSVETIQALLHADA